jgi:hypothetical protein
MRAYGFCFASKLGHYSVRSALRIRANRGHGEPANALITINVGARHGGVAGRGCKDSSRPSSRAIAFDHFMGEGAVLIRTPTSFELGHSHGTMGSSAPWYVSFDGLPLIPVWFGMAAPASTWLGPFISTLADAELAHLVSCVFETPFLSDAHTDVPQEKRKHHGRYDR